ncbi:hypothetical protein PoB_001453600 [Plakobranchus ocellatus]|uniref:Secreted protein n=1 Tax=Plakobranchus ocellatus TaxID=259542 RepID=A0AAV3Z0C2_9GAST|nr:hypothetical protein PoB_001453600 [Plakobranchus ocellatus]
MINTAAFWMSLASAVPFLMEHIGSVIMTFRGTLNVLWTVRPPGSRVAAKRLLAVAMAILPCDFVMPVMFSHSLLAHPSNKCLPCCDLWTELCCCKHESALVSTSVCPIVPFLAHVECCIQPLFPYHISLKHHGQLVANQKSPKPYHSLKKSFALCVLGRSVLCEASV